MRKISPVVLLIVAISFCTKSEAQQKLLPENSNNPAWFNGGKIGIGTQNPTSTLSVNGGFDVYGGYTNFYTNGFKALSILYNEAWPEAATASTISRLEIGIAQGNNSYWPGAGKGDITFRIGGGLTSGGHRLTLGTMYTRNTEPRSYVALGGYCGHSGVVAHNNGSVTIGTNASGNTDEFFVNAASRFNKNVGIGAVPTDDNKLTVDGTILAKEVKVSTNASDWADFVFEEDYPLRDLAQVEAFIREHKHLPDIPGAREMEASGINLAKMNKLLLQKIEELTLYAIEQEGKLKEKDRTVESLKSEVTELRKVNKNTVERLGKIEALLMK